MRNIVEIISSSVDKKPVDTVKFTPYRGEIEPVKEVRTAEINFYANAIEVILHYEYVEVTGGEKSDGLVRFAEMMSKGSFSLMIATSSHPEDDERVPTVFLQGSHSDTIFLKCKNWKEAEKVYDKIKSWLIS